MSKRVQYAQSFPVLTTSPGPEDDRIVFYGKADGLYARLEDNTEIGPFGAGGGEAPDLSGYATLAGAQTFTGDKNFTGALTQNSTAVVLTNDARLSNARTPTAHTHASTQISDSSELGRSILTALDAPTVRTAIGAGTSSFDGAYGSLSGKPTLGSAAAYNVGTGASEVVLGNDARLADARTPLSHTHASTQISDSTPLGRALLTAADAAAARAEIGAGTSNFNGTYSALTGKPTLGTAAALDTGTGVTNVIIGNDVRLSDARTPVAHSHAIADLSATGTKNSTTFLRGDATWASVPAPSNMVTTTDSGQSVAGKRFTGDVQLGDHTSAPDNTSSPSLIFTATGENTTERSIYVAALPGVSAPYLSVSGEFRADSVFDNGNRVYSASNAPTAAAISDSTTTGRAVLTAADAAAARTAIGAGTSNFSGAYSALTGIPTNLVTTDGAQTVTGGKTFSGTVNVNTNLQANGGVAVNAAAAADATTTFRNSTTINFRSVYWNGTTSVTTDTNLRAVRSSVTPSDVILSSDRAFTAPGVYDGTDRVYSDANPPETLMVTETAAAPATPASGFGVLYTLTSDSRPRFKNDLGQVMCLDNIEPYVMAVTGALTVQAGKSRIYCETACEIESIRASVNTAPAGASLIVDVNLNGTSIYTNQANRPTIIAGANTGLGGAPGSTSIAAGQYITVDIDQVGSTTAGSDLTVVIRLRRV